MEIEAKNPARRKRGRPCAALPWCGRGSLRRIWRSARFGLRAVEQPQGVRAAQAVEEVAAQSRQRHEVTAVGVGGSHADQRHKQRDQRRGRQQNDACGPIDREDGDQNQQRDEHRQIHLRQIARVIVLHILDLLDDDAGPAARRFAPIRAGPSCCSLSSTCWRMRWRITCPHRKPIRSRSQLTAPAARTQRPAR